MYISIPIYLSIYLSISIYVCICMYMYVYTHRILCQTGAGTAPYRTPQPERKKNSVSVSEYLRTQEIHALTAEAVEVYLRLFFYRQTDFFFLKAY